MNTTIWTNVRAAILHPHTAVRLAAIRYFVDSHDRSPSVLPAVIQAMQRYPADAQELVEAAETLPHSRSSVQWILNQMHKPWDPANRMHANYRFALTLSLLQAPPEMLLARRQDILDADAIPPELEVEFDETLKMHKASWKFLLAELETYTKACERESGFPSRLARRRVTRLVAAMARHKDQFQHVLASLTADTQDKNPDELDLLDHARIDLAGRMGIHAAIPVLLRRLEQSRGEHQLPEISALTRLGNSTLVQAVIERWPALSSWQRANFGELLSRIHVPIAVAFGLDAFDQEPKGQLKRLLASQVLEHFAPETFATIYRYVLANKVARTDTFAALPSALVIVATVAGITFDHLEAWHKKLDAQLRRERETDHAVEGETWIADRYEEPPVGPTPPRKIKPKTAAAWVLEICTTESDYVGRVRVPDLTLEDLHEVLTIVTGQERSKYYTFKAGTVRFSTGRAGSSAADPLHTALSGLFSGQKVATYFPDNQEMLGLVLAVRRMKMLPDKRAGLRFWEGTRGELAASGAEGGQLYRDMVRELGEELPSAAAINAELLRVFR